LTEGAESLPIEPLCLSGEIKLEINNKKISQTIESTKHSSRSAAPCRICDTVQGCGSPAPQLFELLDTGVKYKTRLNTKKGLLSVSLTFLIFSHEKKQNSSFQLKMAKNYSKVKS
jgi:hypothetical protein